MAKKSFNEITNPALQFMTQTEDTRTAASESADTAAGFKGLKRGRPTCKEETKSKRVNLLFLPSVHEDITKIAAMKRSSVNDLISTLLQDYIEENRELIDRYNQTFGE